MASTLSMSSWDGPWWLIPRPKTKPIRLLQPSANSSPKTASPLSSKSSLGTILAVSVTICSRGRKSPDRRQDLLRPDDHENPRLLPFHVQVGAVVGVLVQGDGELLNGHHDLLFLHVHARQVLLLMVFSAPLPGLLVDDELPCAFRRERVQGVSSGRHFGAAYIERDGRGERGGFIGPGTPDFSVGRKICPQLSALERRTAVVNGDFLAVDGAVSGAGRAGTLTVVLR